MATQAAASQCFGGAQGAQSPFPTSRPQQLGRLVCSLSQRPGACLPPEKGGRQGVGEVRRGRGAGTPKASVHTRHVGPRSTAEHGEGRADILLTRSLCPSSETCSTRLQRPVTLLTASGVGGAEEPKAGAPCLWHTQEGCEGQPSGTEEQSISCR